MADLLTFPPILVWAALLLIVVALLLIDSVKRRRRQRAVWEARDKERRERFKDNPAGHIKALADEMLETSDSFRTFELSCEMRDVARRWSEQG
jgi:heme exporter protein D